MRRVTQLIRALRDEDEEVRAEAAEQLGDLETAAGRAIPALFNALSDEDPLVCWKAAQALCTWEPSDGVPPWAAIEAVIDRSALAALLDDDNPLVHIAAARLLVMCDDKIEGPHMVLLSGLLDEDSEIAELACLALSKPILGAIEPLVPGNREALRSRPDQLHQATLDALGRIGIPNERVVSALVERLCYSDWEQSIAIVRALGHMSPRSEEAVEALHALAMQTNNSELEAEAIWALGELRPVTRSVILALIDIMTSGKGWNREIAGGLLAGFEDRVLASGLLDRESIVKLVKSLADTWVKSDVQSAAEGLLRRSGALSNGVLDSLRDAFWYLDSADFDLARFAMLGPEARELAIPALSELLWFPDWRIIQNSAQALGIISPGKAIEALLEGQYNGDIDNPDIHFGWTIEYILDRADPADVLNYFQARESVPLLLELAELGEPEFRRAVGHVLGMSLGNEAVPILAQILADDFRLGGRHEYVTPTRRCLAARALGTFGPASRDAFPNLVKVFNETRDGDLHLAALGAMIRIGPVEAVVTSLSAAPGVKNVVIPALLAILESRESDVWPATIDALGPFGPRMREAVHGLFAVARNTEEDTPIRRAAIRSIRAIGPDAEALVGQPVAPLVASLEARVGKSAREAHRDG